MLKRLFLCISIISITILTACGQSEKESEQHSDHDEHSMGDIREETASASELPSFLDDKPEDMRTIYAAVAHNGELLQYIPCYCGCGSTVGHKNNDHCFIKERKEDGKIIWDDHGTKCEVCLNIAAAAIVDYQKGKSIKEIRTEIDEQYKEGFAEPTPTPMPSEDI
ncbi:PCYCGC motif-containing (lipo)protein [Metabacillus fastidiosus]|uniref:PCYCGC motif-containing (lipo)protein n=1 Tax=Metabacillus fastidiosus TaxID=1458 RepID=UPI003D2C3886